jgi:hypothetical protein
VSTNDLRKLPWLLNLRDPVRVGDWQALQYATAALQMMQLLGMIADVGVECVLMEIP